MHSIRQQARSEARILDARATTLCRYDHIGSSRLSRPAFQMLPRQRVMDMRADRHTRLDEWLYLLLIFSLPLVRPFNLIAWGLLVPLTDFIFVGAALAWLLALANKKASFRRSWFYLPLALYLGALIISSVASTVPRQS